MHMVYVFTTYVKIIMLYNINVMYTPTVVYHIRTLGKSREV